jgi:hypothetical protein
MQDIERNMDDLFCKAAQNYQPKPGESNWDKIASQLSTGAVIPPALQEKNNKKKYFLILSLLLLFLFTGGLLIKYPVDKNRITVLQRPSKAASNSSGKVDHVDKKANAIFEKQGREVQLSTEKDYFIQEDNPGIPYNSLPIKKSKDDSIVVIKGAQKNTQPHMCSSTVKDDGGKNLSALINGYNAAPIVQNKSVMKEKADRVDNPKNVVSPVLKQQGVYFGAAIGASFNSVKYQGFRKPGFDIGAIAGYQLNNKISFETGLFFGKRHYFSNGKYFSMDKVGSSMPPQMKIVSLEGSSSLFEIPLKFTYSILKKKKTTFCSSAGISSYLLTKEKNIYLTLMNGTSENVVGLYNNSSGYFAAAIDFSVGYQYKLSNNKNIRIEPYLQIPLKGIGMGTLPVMSVGLHFGFTVFPH